MKKFLARVILYLVLVVGTIMGVCVLEVAAEIRAYRSELVAPPCARIAMCGDSQLGNSVDPETCPEFFNFSAHGRAPDQAYLAAIDVLRANRGRIDCLLVDLSPAAATWSQDAQFKDMAFSANYWLLHYLHIGENQRDLRGGVRVARDCLVGKRLRHAWRALRGKVKFRSSLYGHYTAFSETNRKDSPRRYHELMVQKAEATRGAADIGFDSAMFTTLAKTVRLAAAEGVEVVVVTTPWHPDLIGRCGEAELDRFVARLSEWTSRRGIRYLNFLKEHFPEECWLDANHLNSNGAKVFTPMLLRALRDGDRKHRAALSRGWPKLCYNTP